MFNPVGMHPAKMEKMLVNAMKELKEAGKHVLNPSTRAGPMATAGLFKKHLG